MPIRQVHLTHSGDRHGPITRVFSPSDLGEILKPFVFLDYLDTPLDKGFGFGFHPHSGIATLTYPLTFDAAYEESHGIKGIVRAGGIEWMKSGKGVWHKATPQRAEGHSAHGQGFQLWVALPAGVEHEPSEGHYLSPDQVETEGATRVLTGAYDQAKGHVPTPTDMNYFYVKLEGQTEWAFIPPESHEVAWLYVHAGSLQISEKTYPSNTLVVFEKTGNIAVTAGKGGAGFVFGSARPHPYPLVLGRYSVHTSPASLAVGELHIGSLYQALKIREQR